MKLLALIFWGMILGEIPAQILMPKGEINNVQRDSLDKKVAKKNKIYVIVEQQPEFPGGVAKMYQFLSKNVIYPPEALKVNVTGKIMAKFIVRKDGTITDIELVRDTGFGLGDEVVRVIKTMPKWNAATNHGQKVDAWYFLPISCFLLE